MEPKKVSLLDFSYNKHALVISIDMPCGQMCPKMIFEQNNFILDQCALWNTPIFVSLFSFSYSNVTPIWPSEPPTVMWIFFCLCAKFQSYCLVLLTKRLYSRVQSTLNSYWKWITASNQYIFCNFLVHFPKRIPTNENTPTKVWTFKVQLAS